MILTLLGFALFAAPARSGPAQVVIDTDTFWPEAVYEIESLTIRNGAMLTIAGGSTLDVAGDLSAIESSTLLLEAKNTAATVDGGWLGMGVAVQAGNVAVEAGSAISADGQGYEGGAGPGAGESHVGCGGSTAGSGAGHGGAGGDAGFQTLGGAAYGSAITPTDLGSGGGNNPPCETSTANAGGGTIVLHVNGFLQLNGRITANGAAELLPRLGGGSGGSIYVTTNILTGTGFFSANGADGGNEFAGGGGGGRISVSYARAPSFTGFMASTANGGMGFADGSPGTVAFLDTSTSHSHLLVFQNLAFEEDSDLTYGAVTLDNLAVMRVGGGSVLRVLGDLILTGSSTLLLEGKNRTDLMLGEWQGEGVAIDAGNVSIAPGSKISADGQGYVGTAGPGAGESDTRCGAGTAGAGGGHGGRGGGGRLGTEGGAPYGSPVTPTDLGSGGGNNPGCNVRSNVNSGGGAIVLDVSGVLQLDGEITADGALGVPERLGGGAGGSIVVTTHRLTGSGFFSADGASSGNDSSGGGAGGRISVYYDEAPAFGGFFSSTAEGGNGFEDGEPGTTVFFDTSIEPPHMHIFQNLVFGPDSEIAYGAITLANHAMMRLGGGSHLTVAGDLVIGGDSTLLLQGKNTTSLVAGEWVGEGVTITARNVTVDTGSRISADGQGYVGTAGPGAGGSDPGCGAITAGAGGGHGGRGGDARHGILGGPPYGSSTTPIDPGSGGGNNPGCNVHSTVNAGGGWIGLEVEGALAVNGAITADAEGALPERLGGGAGGALYVTTNALTGTGIFSAAGADAGSDAAGGGAGGRIAVYSARGAGFAGLRTASVAGGNGFAGGTPGSLLFVDTQCDGDCDEDGTVNINELVEGVGIAIAGSAAERCLAADADANAIVSVDELIRATGHALRGCDD